MSSLRIAGSNGTSRDPAVGGEAGRSETPAGRGAFAAVLGIAGEAVAAKGLTDATPDPGNGGAPSNTDPRKRGDGDAKAGLATALAAASSIIVPPVAPPVIAPTLTSPLDAASASLVGADAIDAAASDAAVAAAAGDKSAAAGSFGAAVGSPQGTPSPVPSTEPVPTTGIEPGPGGVARDPTPSATAVSPAPTGDPAAGPVSSASVGVVATGSDPTPPAAPPAAPPIPAAAPAGGPPILTAPVADLGGTAGGDAFGSGDRDHGEAAFAASPGDSAAVVATVGGSAPALPAAVPDGAPATAPFADAVAAGAAGAADQASSHVLHMVSSGARDITVQLHPPELGALTVRIEVSGRDVSAWFDSAQPEVQQAISAGIGQLRTDLGNAGYTLSGAFVGGDGSSGQARGGNSPPPQVTRTAALPAFAASGAPAARPLASGVSIYV